MAPTQLLIQDSCAFSLPEILAVALVAITDVRAAHWSGGSNGDMSGCFRKLSHSC